MSMVYFFVPGKVQGKARPRFSSRSGTVYTPGKPDIDNILKVVLDGLNGIAYEDDKQVTMTQCKKVYADTTRPAGLQVHVFPMDNVNGCY